MSPSRSKAAPSGAGTSSHHESAESIELTFILPTRNRARHVTRAIESCLRVQQTGVSVEVLVLDGNSTDGTFEQIQQQFGGDSRVRLMRQQSKGFMAACFEALPLVRTPFATFMYDDDVLSPFWVDLPRGMASRGSGFALGFGAEGSLEETVSFERAGFLRVISPSALLRAYCGAGRDLFRHGLPYSPICCLTTTQELHRWRTEVEGFVQGRPFREYFMMRLNAGPDLLVYFSSILTHDGDVMVFDGAVAQFTVHDTSMTVSSGPIDIPVGYWLAHVWLANQLSRHGGRSDAGWCTAYAVKSGLRLLWKRIRRRRWEWTGSFAKEIALLVGQNLASRNLLTFLKHLFVLLLLPRGLRPKLVLPPPIAQSRS